MSFILGYVHIPPISITTAYIPIIITACLFGPAEASLAGLLFGLGSLYKASATYVMPADAVFSPFRSDFPIRSILLSVGTRMLFRFSARLSVSAGTQKQNEEDLCNGCSSQSRHLSCTRFGLYCDGVVLPLSWFPFFINLYA